MAKAASGFRVGERVRLKSGGPDMSINRTDNVGHFGVECVWFAGKKVERAWFHPDVLELAEPKKQTT